MFPVTIKPITGFGRDPIAWPRGYGRMARSQPLPVKPDVDYREGKIDMLPHLQ